MDQLVKQLNHNKNDIIDKKSHYIYSHIITAIDGSKQQQRHQQSQCCSSKLQKIHKIHAPNSYVNNIYAAISTNTLLSKERSNCFRGRNNIL